MARTRARQRQRGHVRRRGNSFQVLVYAGIDPVTGKPNYLTESTRDETQVDSIMRRLVSEVDEQRNARTKATLGAAIDAWLNVHDVEENTRRSYEMYTRRYVKAAAPGRPGTKALADVPIGKVNVQLLEEFYASCVGAATDATDGSRSTIGSMDHTSAGTVRHRRPPGRPSARAVREHDCTKAKCVVVECPPHKCRPLSASSIRQIHIAISSALGAAVRWDWIKSNPAKIAKKPRLPAPEPDPPSAEEAARILAAAWEQDDDWGTFVWLTLVTGMRRAELLALRWDDIDLANGIVDIRRNYVWINGRGIEKTTKTHRIRRVSLDTATVDVLSAHHERYVEAVRSFGEAPSSRAFLFSNDPTRDRPYHPTR